MAMDNPRKRFKLGATLTCRRARLLGLATLALLTLAIALIRMPTMIIPPQSPERPITSYVLDRGLHSRLVLPNGNGGMVQYTYGDWRYFALQIQTPISAIQALLLPSAGTLGRREFPNERTLKATIQAESGGRLLSIVVAADEVEELRSQLDRRFRQNLDTHVIHRRVGLHFVRDDQAYSFFHNSNHELVQWLKALDCQVDGFITLPNFRVQSQS
jgi:hypothetical protein